MANFLSNIDLNKNELQNVVFHKSSSTPANPKEGQYYYNSVDKKSYIYNGSSWVLSTLPSVTSSDNGKVLMVVNGTWAAASLPLYDGGVS